MCGIAGAVWNRDECNISRETLHRMTSVLSHRGPDDRGLLLSRELAADAPANDVACGLGHRRLSIIDVQGGHQPLSNEDGTIWTVLNGEIYNYRELREELIARGHTFATSTDTEVIVHLYEECGTDCIQKMRGMFAFAVWDHRKGELFLARDRLGQKPLYYCSEPGRLAFASELKALLQIPGMRRAVDPEAIDSFLTYQYIPYPGSIFRDINKLPPRHVALWADGKWTVSEYWRPPYSLENPSATPASDVGHWRRELREVLTEAVRLRMRSDVPVGAFLSGGIDSTIIAGLMQSLSPRPVHTFSMGFPIAAYDERRYARMAAEQLGTEHHEYLVEPSALAALPRLIWHYDEPFGDSSAIPTMALSKVTREIVKVALSGDGGDELFAGYDRYQAVALARNFDWMPPAFRNVFGWQLWQRIPTSTKQRSIGRRAKRFAAALGQSPELRYLRWIGIFDRDQRQHLYTPAFRQRVADFRSEDFLLAAYQACPNRDFMTRTTCADVLSYLPCDILTKVDVASMSYGLEVRSPFMDHEVVALAARMPIELKYQSGLGKRILIDTFADFIPQPIQTRKKMGFGIPLADWFRGDLSGFLRETLLSERALDRGYFQEVAVRELIDAHVSGRWDHSYRLWNLLCLEYWHRVFIDGDGPPTDLRNEAVAASLS